MDGDFFDALTRRLATASSRRATLKRFALGLAGVAGLASSATTQAANDCAKFCNRLPPGQRGQCVADCQAGTGLFFACAGDPAQLCLSADGSSASCCPAGSTCQGGVCSCPPGSEYCEQQGQCVSTYCNYRTQYNRTTCQCECEPPYVPLVNTGACATPCGSDADCGGVPGCCRETPEGQHICGCCGESAYSGCTDHYPCTSSAFCQSCAQAVNTFCASGVCYVAC
jgi:hypothetical protein